MAEKQLIDANDVYSLFGASGLAKLHVADIDTIPRVDAVEVVRCKDCKWYKPGDLFTDIMFCHRLKKTTVNQQNTISVMMISVPTAKGDKVVESLRSIGSIA